MTAEQKKTAAEVLASFREQLSAMYNVEVNVLKPFANRVQSIVDKRLTAKPPPLVEEEFPI